MSDRPGTISDMSAVLPARIHDELAAARAAGLTFATAWPHVVESVDVAGDSEWRPVIDETAPAFLSAYERRPAARAEVALLAVLDDPDREPFVALEAIDPRHCQHCASPIAEERLNAKPRRPVKYCGDRCRRDAYEARRAAGA